MEKKKKTKKEEKKRRRKTRTRIRRRNLQIKFELHITLGSLLFTKDKNEAESKLDSESNLLLTG